ncbi:MAG: TolC family protein [Candidatus Obscuribacterales bacterium]|nr:TolC family protein [Candidatus Obscuribacterales bacterium]
MRKLGGYLSAVVVAVLACCSCANVGAAELREPVGFPKRVTLPALSATAVIARRDELQFEPFLASVDAFYPQLDAADSRRRIASARRLEVQGAFDPVLTTLDGFTLMQNTSKFATRKRVVFNQPGLEIPFRSGVRILSTYRYNPRSAQSNFIETGYGGEYAGGVGVPLLRGLIVNERETNEKVAKIEEPVATQTFSLTRLDILLRASLSYWNWVGAQRKLEVTRKLVQLSELLVAVAGKRAQAGDLPRIDVTEAEEDIQRRKADQIAADLDFKRATFELSVYLFDNNRRPCPYLSETNVPPQWPLPQQFTVEQTEACVAKAIARRPELKRIGLQRNQARLRLKLAKNDLLPQADALYTQGYDTGQSGIGNVYRMQVNFSEPLFLRGARGRMKANEFNIDALNSEEIAERQRLVAEVMTAAAAINAAHQRYLAVQLQTVKANEVYQGEQRRFSMGDSTVFLVTQRERQLFDARINLINTQVEYLQALARMRALTVDY